VESRTTVCFVQQASLERAFQGRTSGDQHDAKQCWYQELAESKWTVWKRSLDSCKLRSNAVEPFAECRRRDRATVPRCPAFFGVVCLSVGRVAHEGPPGNREYHCDVRRLQAYPNRQPEHAQWTIVTHCYTTIEHWPFQSHVPVECFSMLHKTNSNKSTVLCGLKHRFYVPKKWNTLVLTSHTSQRHTIINICKCICRTQMCIYIQVHKLWRKMHLIFEIEGQCDWTTGPDCLKIRNGPQ